MLPERAEKRPSKGARKRIRVLKSQIRHELGLSKAQVDSHLWDETVEILRREIPDFQERIVPYLTVVYEFFELRQHIREGGSVNVIDDFYHEHGKELIKELAPAFTIVRRTLTPKR